MNHSMPGLPVHHHLLEFTQTYVHPVGDANQTSHPLLSPSPLAPNPIQHQSLFQWVNSSHEVAKKYWSFSFSIIPSKEIPGLISLLNVFCKEGPVFFFSFSLENSLDLEKLSIFWATFISQQQQNTCKSPADRLPHLALVTSSFPLAWVRLVTVSCLESIQVSHYPIVRSPRAPFVSVSRCWGGRWKEKGVQRYRATSLHCEHQGPSTVGLHSCSKYSPLHKMYKTFI